MIQLIDLITFFLSTYMLIKNARNIGRDSRFLIGVLVYVFYIIPLGLDWLYEMADYSYARNRVGFILPRQDFLTNLIYDILMLLTLYCVFYKYKNQLVRGRNSMYFNDSWFKILMYVGMMLPAFATIVLLNNPQMLFAFQWRELGIYESVGSYATIERFTYLGITCSILLLFSKSEKNVLITNILKVGDIVFIYINVCIQGKRAILFYAIINLLLMFYFRLENWRQEGKNILMRVIPILLLSIVGFLFMVSFTSYVKTERGYEEGSTTMYTTTRIDMFRDDRVRMAIYYSIYSTFDSNVPSIVSYPCQTYAADVLSFIPFNYIADYLGYKDASYQTRFTHVLIGKDPDRGIEKGTAWMTVTTFAEVISNLGVFLAFLLIPYMCMKFSSLVDKYAYPYNALVLCSFVLLQLFDFTYISVFLEFTILLCFFSRKRYFKKSVVREKRSNQLIGY